MRRLAKEREEDGRRHQRGLGGKEERPLFPQRPSHQRRGHRRCHRQRRRARRPDGDGAPSRREGAADDKRCRPPKRAPPPRGEGIETRPAHQRNEPRRLVEYGSSSTSAEGQGRQRLRRRHTGGSRGARASIGSAGGAKKNPRVLEHNACPPRHRAETPGSAGRPAADAEAEAAAAAAEKAAAEKAAASCSMDTDGDRHLATPMASSTTT